MVKEVRNPERNLKFAEAEPIRDTLNVDLCIKNPVVRDIVIERCYAALEEEREIEKIIKLLKTEDDGSELSSRRFYGGLKAIGFNNDEANYLKETCALYPMSLLLTRLVTNNTDNSTNKSETENVEISELETSAIDMKATTLSIIQNQETVQQVLHCIVTNNIEDLLQVNQKVVELKEQLELLENFEKSVKMLESKGIMFDYIVSKKDSISKFLELEKNL